MPESNPAAKPLCKQMDTTKDGAKAYLEAASKALGKPAYSAEAFRLAMVRWLLDCAEITDPAKRKAIWQQADALPGWAFCNNSAARQALGYKAEAEAGPVAIDV